MAVTFKRLLILCIKVFFSSYVKCQSMYLGEPKLEIHEVFSAGVTLSQVNNAFLRRDGGNTATDNIDLDSHKIVKVVDSTYPQDVATKKNVDSSKVAKTGDTMTGNLLLKSGEHKLRRIGCYDLNENNAF